MSKTLYAPDDSGEWEDLGPDFRRNWPDGIPPMVITEAGRYVLKQYAGHVWGRLYKEPVNAPGDEQIEPEVDS